METINDFGWLRSARLRELGVSFTGSSLAELGQLKGLTTLTLALGGSNITSLAELGQLKGLTTLTLDLRYSKITSLAPVGQLKSLTSAKLWVPLSLVPNLKIRANEVFVGCRL